ncbi:hydroxyacylglutathione hydrolase [Celeribacter sp.]|uniref:hydroxyacylglutathione hydrolase n=1 Tax=Celeribacter sp. TaxID=1890673 RepID=UPI003A912DC4
MLEIVTVAALSDNYDYLVHDPDTGRTAVVDAAEAEPILDALDYHGWTLTDIWLTHHHWDHIDGVADLVKETGAKVLGAKADQHRLPNLDTVVEAGDSFAFGAHTVEVMPADGHTIGHVAFYIPDAHALFSADSLMALGCGRLFEGTPAQMWETLQRFKALSPETMVYSGHEYTASNAKFALTIETGNTALHDRARAVEAALVEGKFTVPAPLALELATNPFLRANEDSVKAAIGMSGADDIAVFTEIRARKDAF